jgi:hypothetical protein
MGSQLDARDMRIHVYDHIVTRGQPPSSREIAEHFGVERADALQALRTMKIGKTILPHPESGEIWMAGPFASSPTHYNVIGRDTHWWANCAWDMLGVAVIVKEPVRIEARCTDCAAPMTFEVDARREAIKDDSVVHFLVSAAHWYDDIGFT